MLPLELRQGEGLTLLGDASIVVPCLAPECPELTADASFGDQVPEGGREGDAVRDACCVPRCEPCPSAPSSSDSDPGERGGNSDFDLFLISFLSFRLFFQCLPAPFSPAFQQFPCLSEQRRHQQTLSRN